ncbi:MAG TPA: hypothetical protein PLW35_12080, partial [Verrucomicrobiota bacterium]|nr:hypothetical protein [Verrucomicrobiota bacterium]
RYGDRLDIRSDAHMVTDTIFLIPCPALRVGAKWMCPGYNSLWPECGSGRATSHDSGKSRGEA